jgi:hypothetical protein
MTPHNIKFSGIYICRTRLARHTIYQIMNYRKIILLSMSKYCVWRSKIFVILPYVVWCRVPDVLKGHIFHLQGQVVQMKPLLLDCLWFWANILHRTVSYYHWLNGKCDTHLLLIFGAGKTFPLTLPKKMYFTIDFYVYCHVMWVGQQWLA